VSTVFPVRQAVHPTNQHRLSSAGEGRSKDNRKSPQAENDKLPNFFADFIFINACQILRQQPPSSTVGNFTPVDQARPFGF
ncbi:hypothetical protein, partial [Ruegeria arenilitoris]|uniref:hypothetical protein n=1 Tax=Ruegeria arenilitoris TaxID=1173585 RepID=UPI001C2BA539